MITRNPVFRAFGAPANSSSFPSPTHDKMTLRGSLNKTSLLLAPFFCCFLFSWLRVISIPKASAYATAIFVAVVVVCVPSGLIVVWITRAKKQWAPVTAPIYAALQGIVVGFVSAAVDRRFPGIAVQAVCVTLAICFCLIAAYWFGIIQVTDSLRKKVGIAVVGVLTYYVLCFALTTMKIEAPPWMTGWLPSILTSVAIVSIAGFSMVVDFDSVVECAKHRYPRYMESYAALGLLISLIWLYVEVLDLLTKLRTEEERQ
jgi:uncharacterized YccA/Bax inhibitor family protein